MKWTMGRSYISAMTDGSHDTDSFSIGMRDAL